MIKEIDKLEVLTLQDNYIDIIAGDNSEIVQRAMPIKDMEIKNSLLAEHGFSAIVTAYEMEETHSLLFDFGFSDHGAAYNAEALDVDMASIETMALSHGHLDHVGGLLKLSALIGKKGLPLVLHPKAFKNPRYTKISEDFKLYFPPFTREKAEAAGAKIAETAQPYAMLGECILFLGEVPRLTAFEKVPPGFKFEEDGIEKHDEIEDDTAIIGHIKGKGLVVLTGCAHSGVINTVRHAQEVTGVKEVHAIMGGFHLSGADEESVVNPTLKALKEINPDIIIPTHCTGRDAIMKIEREMPEAFILNMVGTRMTFSA